jgi:hypothetical protein
VKLNTNQIIVILLASAVLAGIALKDEFFGSAKGPPIFISLICLADLLFAYFFRTKKNST